MKTYYEVRTRNWNENRKVNFWLTLTILLGVNKFPNDGMDNKYLLITSHPKLAALVFKIFKKFQPLSGGMTTKETLPEICVKEMKNLKWRII